MVTHYTHDEVSYFSLSGDEPFISQNFFFFK